MNNETYTPCTKCGRPMAYCKGQCCGKTKGCHCQEYGPKVCGAIRPGEPKCPYQAVIPSLTVESVSNLKDLADCFVHVSDINTTFYIDDKHRIMTTWAGLVSVEDYDFDTNPLNLRGQIAYDSKNNVAAIYDKQGANYIFQISDINNDYMLLEDKPKINGVTLEGNKSAADLGIPDVDEVAIVFDTVADMKQATNLVNGSYARTLGFHTIDDGGGAIYKITSTGTANEMNVIAVGDSYANLAPLDVITPEIFGAYGDNAHDDYTAIQGAIDYANTHHLIIEFTPRTYLVSDTIRLYTGTVYNGNGATLKETSDLPTVATAKYFDESLSGFKIKLQNFIIEGNTANSNNDGVIVCGWKDTIDNVQIRNVGGHGLVITSYTNDGNEITGSTLVEGEILNVKSSTSNSSKYPLYVHCNAVHITDWRIMNSIFASNNCSAFMYFDRVSGWFMDNVQCYGVANDYGILTKFASGNNFSNITIDGAKSIAFAIQAQLGSVNMNNIHINIANEATGEFDAIQQTGASSNPCSLVLTNLNVNYLTNSNPSSLYLHRGSSYIFEANNICFINGHTEVAYKLYQYKGNNDVYRFNGRVINKDNDIIINNNINAKHYTYSTYSATSTTLPLSIPTPIDGLAHNGILVITGEVNGLPRGNSVYSVMLGRRGTTQPISLITEDASYQFTNVSVTRASDNSYSVSATTPTTGNCNYTITLIF